MKKTVFFSIMASLLLFSCKKEHKNAPAPEQKTYQVNFNVSGFTQQIVGSTGNKLQTNSLQTNSVTALGASSDFLYYRVYDSTTGAIVHQTVQDSSMANFGSVVDYLPAGKYIFVFVACKPNVTLNNYGMPNAGMTFGPGLSSWSDTFYKSDTLTVSTGNINQNITLKRVVGQLTIKLNDIFPANASKINIFVSEELNAFSFATSNWATGGHTVQLNFNSIIADSLKVKSGYKRSIFMMNDFRPFTVTVTCYDSANKVLVQSVIPNVVVQWNTQTILTGNLFGSGAGFHVGLTLPWNPTPINIPF